MEFIHFSSFHIFAGSFSIIDNDGEYLDKFMVAELVKVISLLFIKLRT